MAQLHRMLSSVGNKESFFSDQLCLPSYSKLAVFLINVKQVFYAGE